MPRRSAILSDAFRGGPVPPCRVRQAQFYRRSRPGQRPMGRCGDGPPSTIRCIGHFGIGNVAAGSAAGPTGRGARPFLVPKGKKAAEFPTVFLGAPGDIEDTRCRISSGIGTAPWPVRRLPDSRVHKASRTEPPGNGRRRTQRRSLAATSPVRANSRLLRSCQPDSSHHRRPLSTLILFLTARNA